jgi:phosphomannomutase
VEELTRRFKKRIGFQGGNGIIQARLGGGFSRINFVTMQLMAHGIGEYMCEKYDRNDLANLGVVIGYDSRYDS